MFVETVTAPRDEWEKWKERLRYTSDPPAALVASVAWVGTDGQVTTLNVWDTPDAVADFYMERVSAFVQAEGEPPNKPERHGQPIAAYFRR
jgi:hypothetical protein